MTLDNTNNHVGKGKGEGDAMGYLSARNAKGDRWHYYTRTPSSTHTESLTRSAE